MRRRLFLGLLVVGAAEVLACNVLDNLSPAGDSADVAADAATSDQTLTPAADGSHDDAMPSGPLDSGLGPGPDADASDAGPTDASSPVDATPVLCSGDAGTLDTGFGDGGVVVGPAENASGQRLAADPDGVHVLLAATLPSEQVMAVRLDRDGAFDTSFGTGGRATMSGSAIAGLLVQPDRKVVLSGSFSTIVAPPGGGITVTTGIQVSRLMPDGQPDPTFGGTGIVQRKNQSGRFAGASVARQSDGKLVLAGVEVQATGIPRPALLRYRTDGTLDPAFGTGGVVDATSTAGASALAIQPDGKILLAGYAEFVDASNNAHFKVWLARHLADGNLDPTFGSGGVVAADFGDSRDQQASGVAIDALGRIVVAGSIRLAGNSSDFLVARFTSSGAVDTSFGSSGRVMTDFQGRGDHGADVAILPTGAILVTGTSNATVGFRSSFAMARYLPSGDLDPGFGASGTLLQSFSGPMGSDVSTGLLADPSGCSALAIGSVRAGTTAMDAFAVARFAQ